MLDDITLWNFSTVIWASIILIGMSHLWRSLFSTSTSNGKFKLYGWGLSYFTGKAQSYLIYKGIDFELIPMTMFDLNVKIPLKTGAKVMPVMESPEGKWTQDTRDIIDTMDEQFQNSTVFPRDPVILFVSNLFEAWGDEWFIPHAMHQRWNNEENVAFFKKEAGFHLFPWMPGFLRSLSANPVANILIGFLPHVGVRPHQFKQLDSWTMDIMHDLNIHFGTVPYLFGNRPTIGDFGLIGSMYAHFSRDPYARRTVVDPFPRVLDWINRMQSLSHSKIEELYPTPNLSLPATLAPIMTKIVTEFVPMIESINNLIVKFHENPKFSAASGKPVPRRLGQITFPMCGKPFQRMGLPHPLYKMQGTMDLYHAMSEEHQTATRNYLLQFGEGADRLLQMKIPRMQRCALTVKFV